MSGFYLWPKRSHATRLLLGNITIGADGDGASVFVADAQRIKNKVQRTKSESPLGMNS
jgi:hypothetical protein